MHITILHVNDITIICGSIPVEFSYDNFIPSSY